MTDDEQEDFGGVPLQALFRREAESQVQILTEGLLALEQDEHALNQIEPLMRAAHSLKGAARIVGLELIERLAHVMEDCFLAVRKQSLHLTRAHIDRLLAGVDVIAELAPLDPTQVQAWVQENEARIADLMVALYEAAGAAGDSSARPAPEPAGMPRPRRATASGPKRSAPPPPTSEPDRRPKPEPEASASSNGATSFEHPSAAGADSTREGNALRVDVQRFDRLLALASEARVAAHALAPQLAALQRLRQKQHEALGALEQVRLLVHGEVAQADLDAAHQRLEPLERSLAERLVELDTYEGRMLSISRRFLDEVLDLRMRPFRDATHGLPRMVRDLAHALGKEARLDVTGGDTTVDREVLAQLDAPLNQLLRNAVDHGIEAPQERTAAGKTPTGSIRLDAHHAGGMLVIRVSDDGRGLDPEQIRRTLVARGMSNAQMAETMSSAELFDFLLLPGFSLREQATQISGRGVGLDVVADTVRRANGGLRLESRAGHGTTVVITLPLSQSLLHALVVAAAGEVLALPLAQVGRVLRVSPNEVHALADRRFFVLEGQHVDLVPLAPLLELGAAPAQAEQLATVVIGAAAKRFGLVVDQIIGERNLAVQPLPSALGKLQDVAGCALLDDGTPVLVLDQADLLQSIDKLAGEGGLQGMPGTPRQARRTRRVLVVDDSLTVREMERKLLHARGYEVEVAVDGMDGWNAVRGGSFDLVITDVDMPRLDGIELVSLIKKDERLRHLPVMIVSYKDRPEDRMRGIDAGADYYLAKGSFHDETLLDAVADLIGESRL